MITSLTDQLRTAGTRSRTVPPACDQRGRPRAPGSFGTLADIAAPTALGYDTVEVPAEHGTWILDRLPRAGYVLADRDHWWWAVPPESHEGMPWPAFTHYATGAARVSALSGRPGPEPCADGPYLVHAPDDDVPYTHPILLCIVLCGIAGVRPVWS